MARRRSRKQNHSGFKKLECLFVLLVVLVTAVGVFRQFPNVLTPCRAFCERQFQPETSSLEPHVSMPEPSIVAPISQQELSARSNIFCKSKDRSMPQPPRR